MVGATDYDRALLAEDHAIRREEEILLPDLEDVVTAQDLLKISFQRADRWEFSE
jgi:hypothetical protein